MSAESDELEQAFGKVEGRVSEVGWPRRAKTVLDYVRRWDRNPVTDYNAIRRFLQERWGLPVVETEHAVGAMGPLAEADRDYGRCSVRLLDLLGETNVYVVIRKRENRSRWMLWALLHELGHFVNHFERLLSLATLYQRVCLDPPLEAEIGRFVRRAAATLHARAELDADLFAIDWLLPRWIDDDREISRRGLLTSGLSADGYRFVRLRSVLDDRPLPRLRTDVVDRLNRSGAEERRRSAGAFPHEASLWRRASWVLFNRNGHGVEDGGVTTLISEYYRIAGYPPRYVPELTHRRGRDRGFDPSVVWLPRISSSEAAREVDGVQWAPLLVPYAASEHPDYHIPIRPVPAVGSRDSTLRWRHMLNSTLRPPRQLDEWLARAQEQRVGLLLFPRNPAERSLDDGRGACT
jgi:hypothetical protein